MGRLNYPFRSGKLPGRETSWAVRIGLKMGKLPICSVSLPKLSPMRTELDFPRLCPYSTGFWLHDTHGFYHLTYSGVGVAISRGLPTCQRRSGVKRSKCERAIRYSPEVAPRK